MKTNFLFFNRKLFCGKINVITKEKAYQILEICPSSSQAEIRNAYIKLAKTFHPDVNMDSKEKFKEIYEAYELLRDSKMEVKNNSENINTIIDNFLKVHHDENKNEQSLSKKLNRVNSEINQKQAEIHAKSLEMNQEYYKRVQRKFEKIKKKKLEKLMKKDTKSYLNHNNFSVVKDNLNSTNIKKSYAFDEYSKNEMMKNYLNNFSSFFTYMISISTVSVFLIMVGGKYGGLLSLYIIIMTMNKPK